MPTQLASKDLLVPLVGFRGYYDESASKFEYLVTVENACTWHSSQHLFTFEGGQLNRFTMQIGNPVPENYFHVVTTLTSNYDYNFGVLFQMQALSFSVVSLKSARYGTIPAYIDVTII